MATLVASVQGRVVEVYFGFKNIQESVNHTLKYEMKSTHGFERKYQKALTLSELVEFTKQHPCYL